MTRRTLLFASGAFILGAGLAMLAVLFVVPRKNGDVSSIQCRATNAGLELATEHGQVHIYNAGRTADPVAEGTLNETLPVPPGQYDLRVFFSRSADHQTQWVRDVDVVAGERKVVSAAFTTGELIVEARVGAPDAEPHQVVAYVFNLDDHDQIVTSMAPGEAVLIEPGSYDVRVVLNVVAQERDVRWDNIQVNGGALTRLKVEFPRGTLLITAQNAAEPLPPTAVSLTLYRAGDPQEQVIHTGRAGEPMGLPTGSYDVKATLTVANNKPTRWLRDVPIKDNETLERSVAFTAGTVVAKARLSEGDELGPFDVYIYYYRAGDHEQPITYTPLGEPARLSAGRYDVRAHFFRSNDQPDVWIRDQDVPAGQVVRISIAFLSGKLLVRAFDADGAELVGDNIFLHVYPAGQRIRPITTVRSGVLLVLAEGAYDIRAEDTRGISREFWLENVEVRSGALSETSVTFEMAGADEARNTKP